MKNLVFFFLFFWPVLLVGQVGVSEADYNIADTSMARVLLEEAGSLVKKRELDLAFEKATKAKEIFTTILGAETKEVAECWDLIGLVHYFKKDFAGMEEALESALNIELSVYGEHHPSLADTYGNLGNVYKVQGKYGKAIEFYERGLDISLSCGDNSVSIASFYGNLGNVYTDQGQYEKALDFKERALKLWLKAYGKNHPFVADSYHNLGVTYYEQHKYMEAINFYKKGLKLKLSLYEGNHPSVAASYLDLGNAYNKQGRNVEAIDCNKKALDIYLSTYGTNHSLVATSYNNLGMNYKGQGQYEKAMDYSEKALNMRLSIYGENHPDVASSYLNLGNIFYAQSEYGKAIKLYEKAVKIKLSIHGEQHLAIVNAYNNLGTVYSRQGRYEKAIDSYKKILKIYLTAYGENHPNVVTSCLSIGMVYAELCQYERATNYFNKALNIGLLIYEKKHHTLADTYGNLGVIYKNKGQYEKAINFYEKALNIYVSLYGENHPDVATSYYNLDIIYLLQDKYKKAMRYSEKALNIRLSIHEGNHPDIAASYHNIGNIFYAQSQYQEAMDFYKKALKMNLSLYGEIHPNVARYYHNLGLYHDEKGQYEKATEFCEKALDIRLYVYGEKHSEVAFSYHNLGSTYDNLGKYEKAIDLYREALSSLSFTNIENLSYVTSLFHLIRVFQSMGITCYNKCLATKDYTALSDAHHYFKYAIAAHNFHSKSIGLNPKLQIAKKAFEINNFAIDINHLLYQTTDSIHYLHEAFTFSENTKAAQLYETIQESDALSFSNIPDSLLEKEYDLRVNITFYEKQRQEKFNAGLNQTDSTVLKISGKLFDVRRDYEKLKTLFEKEYPDYYRLKYDLSTVGVAEIQKDIIEENETLLEYFVGDSAIYIYVVNQNDFQFHKVEKDFPLEEWIKDFRLANNDKKPTRDVNVEHYHETAHELYQKLIAPVAKHLKEKVIIVPDGILGYLPFEALLVEQADDPLDWRNHHYWLRDKQISYCYSATLLKEMKEKQPKKKAAKGVLALAPFYGTDTVLLTRELPFADPIDLGTLHALPFSGEEVLGIREVLGNTRVDVYTKKYATAAQFTGQASDYKVIHLATHGKADDKVGDYSFLVFAEQEDSTANEFLYVRDLFDLQLNAEMVVLSACQTGIGELQKGEGIISLARGFTYAGTKSIITSLWSVHDESTKDLMVGFYEHLKAGKTKDEALQLCKLDYLGAVPHGKAHPFYWSGFIGIGDMSSIVF